MTGYNFGNTNSSIKCKFGWNYATFDVDAELISSTKLKCTTPTINLSGSGSLATLLRVIVDSQYSYNSVPFSFYAQCPENQCDQGYCSFGKCVCYYGYRGESCDESMMLPILVDPANAFELTESQSFSYQLELKQGTSPLEYSLLGLPIDGIAINASSGILTWASPVVKNSQYQVKLQVTNEMGRDAITLALKVSPSYYVEISAETNEFIRPAPSILFNFVTRDVTTNQAVGNKLAVLWVYEDGKSSGQRRKISVKSNALGLISKYYQPYSKSFGNFLYGGEHPDYSNLTVQGAFSIRGMDINRRYYYISGYPTETVSIDDAFSFLYKGGNYSGINVTFDQVPGVEIVPSLSATTANYQNNTVTMSIQVTSQDAIKGRVYFTVSAEEGVVVSSSYLYLDIRFRAPKLQVSPNTLDIKIANGASDSYYDVSLENIGSRRSSAIAVVMPTQQDVVIKPTTGYISSLDVDEVAEISFKVSIPDEVTVGNTYYGTIGEYV